jgi:hypothetical protein
MKGALMRTSNEQAGQLTLNLCDCGRLHVSYGLVTVHLTREAFLMLAEQVAQAAGVLKGAALDPELQARPPSSACH